MVMLPAVRRKRYIEEFGLPIYDSEILTTSKYMSDYYEECVREYNNPKKISNWIMVDLLKMVNLKDGEKFPISSKDLSTIIKMVEDKKINKTVGLQLLEKVVITKEKPEDLAKKMGLLVTITEKQIIDLIRELKLKNPKVVEDYKIVPEKVETFVVGYVMKNTQGKADSVKVRELIKKEF